MMVEKMRESMTPQDWLGVGIRLFAVWLLVQALQYVVIFAELRMRLASSPTFHGDVDPSLNATGYLVYVVGYGVLAAFLLRGAPVLVAFAYPRPCSETEETPVLPPASSSNA